MRILDFAVTFDIVLTAEHHTRSEDKGMLFLLKVVEALCSSDDFPFSLPRPGEWQNGSSSLSLEIS